MSGELAQFPAGGRIPETDGGAAARGEFTAVRAEGGDADGERVAGQRPLKLSGRDVPQVDGGGSGAGRGSGGGRPAIGGQGQTRQWAVRSVPLSQLFACRDRPNSDDAVVTKRYDFAAVRPECDRCHAFAVTDKLAQP